MVDSPEKNFYLLSCAADARDQIVAIANENLRAVSATISRDGFDDEQTAQALAWDVAGNGLPPDPGCCAITRADLIRGGILAEGSQA